MRKHLVTIAAFCLGLVVFIAIPALAQESKIYRNQGGTQMTVASGGTLVIASGGTLELAAGSTLTGAGLPSTSMTAGMTVTGAAVNLNASSNFAVNVATGTSTGAVTIGSTTSAQSITLQSGTGDVTITSTDDFAFTATDDIAIKGGSAGSILNLGTLTQGGVVNIATDDTTADTVTIGSAKDTIAVAGQNVTVGTAAGTANVVIQSGSGDVSITSTDDIIMTASSNGTAGTGVAAASSLGLVVQDTLTFTLTGANDIDVADGGKSTGVLAFTFPEGRILVLGAVIDASITTNAAYNAHANDDYYVSVGSVDGTQAADADLTSTEADIIPKTTIATDSGGGANTALTAAWHAAMGTLAYANNVFDGTTTPLKLYVNVAVPDAANTGATTHAITGTLKVSYINLGDY